MKKRVLSLMFLMCFPLLVEARLVIIQDEEKLQLKKQQEEAEALAKAEAAKTKEKLRLEEDKARKIREATVKFNADEFNVVADRTEKIIRHFGVYPKQLPPAGGGALESPFWLAMNSIVPAGWKVFTDRAIDAQALVSWSGQRHNWIAILHQFGVQKRLTFDIDWNQRLVLVRPHNSAIDYLREQHRKNESLQEFLITVDGKEGVIPEGGEGVLVINGKPVKVKRAERVVR